MIEMIRAGLELGLARLTLRAKISVILAGADLAQASSPVQDSRQRDFVKRVSYIIPRIAARLPWRADCLVQALAAKQWLRSRGIASTIEMGIPREPPPEFQAHAWLRAGDMVVTGGDVGGYVPFRKPSLKSAAGTGPSNTMGGPLNLPPIVLP